MNARSPWSDVCLWRHKNNRDVAIQVCRAARSEASGRWLLTVQWWNVGVCHMPWPMGLYEEIAVTDEQYPDWEAMGYDEKIV